MLFHSRKWENDPKNISKVSTAATVTRKSEGTSPVSWESFILLISRGRGHLLGFREPSHLCPVQKGWGPYTGTLVGLEVKVTFLVGHKNRASSQKA